MAQHDMNIANQGFPATRADLNNALQALVSNSSGATAPSTTFANQWWYDTTNNKMYIRNEANNAWIEVAVLDQTNNEWQITTGVIQAKDSDGLALKTDDGTTRLFVKDSDGHIGIGTTSADDTLHVYSTSSLDHVKIDGPSGINRNLNFSTAGDNRFNVYVTGSTESGSDVGSDLSFARYDDSGSFLSTAMLIKRSSGHIGIGTSDPQFDLHIHQNNSTNSLVQFTNSTTGATSSDGLLVGLDSAEQAQVWFRENAPLRFATNDTEAMRIQSGGEITSSNNPIFHCQRNSGINNIAVNTTHTMTFASQVIDRGNNHDGSTFTAPVTGAYFLSTTMRLDAIDTAATYYQIIISTSNRAYTYIWDPNFSADLSYYSNTFSVIADMDASDLAQVQIFQSGGSTQTDVNINSFFFGYLCG